MKSIFNGLRIFSLTGIILIAAACLDAKKSPKVTQEQFDELECKPFIILGGGVAGLTAANYLALAGHEPLVLHKTTPQEGGLIAQSHCVQNWPGELAITGAALIKKMQNQATHNGAILKNEEVVSVDFNKNPFVITTRTSDGQEKEYRSLTCLIMMGATPNYLGIPGEQEAWGKGVSNCALCDGPLYKGKRVAIVGGGDSAVTEALYLSNLATHVDLFVRKKELKTKRAALLENLDNVEIHYETEVTRVIEKDGVVTNLEIKIKNETQTVAVDGLFLAIGSKPNSEIARCFTRGTQENEVDQNYLQPGVFAAGDVTDIKYRQAITAAGDACKAAIDAERYVASLGLDLKKNNSKSTKKSIQKKEDHKALLEIPSHEKKALTTLTDIQALSQHGIPYVVDFYADWCGACVAMKPTLEKAEKELAGKMGFYKVNVDNAQDLSQQFSIRGIPAFIFFDTHGKEIKRVVGSRSYKAFLDECTDVLK